MKCETRKIKERAKKEKARDVARIESKRPPHPLLTKIARRPVSRGTIGQNRVPTPERKVLARLLKDGRFTIAELHRATKVSPLSLRRWREEFAGKKAS